MKKIYLLVLLLLTANAYAITIINNNTYKISYSIRHGETCSIEYVEDALSPNTSITWIGNSEVRPDDVCIYARGKTSLVGTFCRDVDNLTGIVEIRDAGLFRGVTCRCLQGCA